MTTEALIPLQPDLIQLEKDLKEIRQEQLSGAWAPGNKTGAELEAHDLYVQQRTKRALEIISILRRTNTGPAKAKRSKKAANVEALNDEMLA